ncbi:head-tail adaptor protein [Streptomyces sp. SID10815]|uniref:phage head completion protein n=1 Tax=Streptomyces sp. SID10815 TaxID=2706027 RepID=UPI0013C60B62|nr:head-tail adaptor protein [Streptomyces sp. SID10815]NEA52424.1 head-tail adaptor protein [Streptomyces sp. SID10815]
MPYNIGRQTVTILDAPLVAGPYNAQTRDWERAIETVVRGCTIDVTGSSETQNASDQTVTTARLDLPPRAVRVTEWMRVRWQDRIWEVDGVPADPEMAGALAGQVVELREVAG